LYREVLSVDREVRRRIHGWVHRELGDVLMGYIAISSWEDQWLRCQPADGKSRKLEDKCDGMYPIEGMWFDLREFVFHVIRIHGSYLFFGRSSEDFDDFNELIDTRFSWEQRWSSKQFRHNTSSWPDIYL